MGHWTVKVRILETDAESGKLKVKNETYLVDSESINATHALIGEFFKETSIDYEIRGISKSAITEYITIDSINK